MKWPFSNKISALSQPMPSKAGQEERLKKVAHEQLSMSDFQPLSIIESSETKRESSFGVASQTFHSLVQQQVHRPSVHLNPLQVWESSAASKLDLNKSIMFPVASHPSFSDVNGFPNGPDSMAGPLKQQQPFGAGTAVKVPHMGSPIGAFSPWKSQRSSALTAQLTMFYNGAVNVYDDVPQEKAQEIMLLASNVAKVASSTLNVRTSEPVLESTEVAQLDGPNEKLIQDQSLNRVQVNYLPLSPLSLAATSESQSGCSSITIDDVTGEKSVEPIATPLKTSATSAAPVIRGAVPQFRKASLARFLEKRKERLAKPLPYFNKKLEDSHIASDCPIPVNKSTAADISVSSHTEQDSSAQPKKRFNGAESPSTKLEI